MATKKFKLDGRLLYTAPSGRLCQYVPDRGDRDVAWVTFQYVDKRRQWMGVGFALSKANLHIMRIAE